MLLLLAVFWDGATRVQAMPYFFVVERVVEVEGHLGERACAVLDGTVYAHAARDLADVRMFARSFGDSGSAPREIPYALTLSETAAIGDRAKVLDVSLTKVNSGARGRHVSFDLEMPSRAYTIVDLELGGKDFTASATVTGLKGMDDRQGVSLGVFTLFDLSGQGLSRNTTLGLQESSFPFLHVDLAVTGMAGHKNFEMTPAIILGAVVPPSRSAQTIYTSVLEATTFEQRGRQTVATLALPAHVPVERVSFTIVGDNHTNFSRSVTIKARPLQYLQGREQREAQPFDEIEGKISRVRTMEAGRQLRLETLSIPATLAANAQGDATVEVAIENGDDQPLSFLAVRLEMRQRKLCFDIPAIPIAMFYGDTALKAPAYDYMRSFQVGERTRPARLGPEFANPIYKTRSVEAKSLTERHPEILWLALLGAISVLGVVAFRSARHHGF